MKHRSKLLKIFLFSLMGFMLIMTFVLIYLFDNPVFQITTIKKSYCYVNTYSETQKVEVLFYVNSKKTIFTDKDKLLSAYIVDEGEENVIKINLLSITDQNKSEEIKNKKFHLFSFVFDIPLKTESDYEIKINDAIISLEYASKRMNIHIGSFYYCKIPYFGDNMEKLSISKIKPIVNYIYSNKTLTGLNLGLRNNTDEQMEIVSIKILENNIYPSIKDIKKIDYSITSNMEISEILGYKYEVLSNTNIYSLSTTIILQEYENSEFIIPIKYLNTLPVDTIGLLIEYKLNGSIQKLYYDDFMLFKDLEVKIIESNMDIYTYENS